MKTLARLGWAAAIALLASASKPLPAAETPAPGAVATAKSAEAETTRQGPLLFPRGPAGGAEAAVAIVQRLIAPGATQLAASVPVAFYSLPNTANVTLRDGHLEGALTDGSFYYFVNNYAQPVSMVAVKTNATTGRPEVQSATSKPRPEISEAFALLAKEQQLQGAIYEVRVLGYTTLAGRGNSEAHYVLWLKAGADGTDLISSLAQPNPNPGAKPTVQLSSAAHFIQSLPGHR